VLSGRSQGWRRRPAGGRRGGRAAGHGPSSTPMAR